MVPPQQGSIVWATGIVIKWLRVHHTRLPRPPSLRLRVFDIIDHCLKLLLKLLLLQLLHVHLLILLLMLLRPMLDISTTSSGTPTSSEEQHLPPPSVGYALSCFASLTRWVEEEPFVTCTQHNQHKHSTKQTMKTNTGCFRNLFFGLQHYSPENEIRIASVQKKKNGTNYLHS